ncbi:hypothetical protein M9458_038052, partial [Cirrhinus mrigala]
VLTVWHVTAGRASEDHRVQRVSQAAPEKLVLLDFLDFVKQLHVWQRLPTLLPDYKRQE